MPRPEIRAPILSGGNQTVPFAPRPAIRAPILNGHGSANKPPMPNHDEPTLPDELVTGDPPQDEVDGPRSSVRPGSDRGTDEPATAPVESPTEPPPPQADNNQRIINALWREAHAIRNLTRERREQWVNARRSQLESLTAGLPPLRDPNQEVNVIRPPSIDWDDILFQFDLDIGPAALEARWYDPNNPEHVRARLWRHALEIQQQNNPIRPGPRSDFGIRNHSLPGSGSTRD